ERGLDAEHRRRIGPGLLLGGTAEAKERLDVLEVLLPALLHPRVVREVEVAAGQAHPALVEVGDDLRAVAIVLDGAEAEERRRGVGVVRGQAAGRAGDRRVEPGDPRREGALAADRVDARQVRLDGRGARGLDAGLVHARRPVVTDLL